MNTKRILALLMALTLAIGALSGGFAPASAAETSVNPYTLSIQNYDFDNDTGVHKWLGLVTSPFWVEVETTANGGGDNEVVLFDLYDETNGHSIEAFCIDVDTGIDNAFYKRINLEDSEYFDAASAQKIRAIVNHGVTVKTLAQMTSAANAWLSANGMPELVNLRGTEALTATQFAIWSWANGDDIVSADPYSDYYVQSYTYVWASENGGNGDTYTTECGNAITYNDAIQYAEDGTNLSEQNITGLAKYLLSLEPQAAREVAVSDKAIRDLQVSYTANEDGTYDALVSFAIDENLTIDDADLTLSVSSMDLVYSADLTLGQQNVTLKGVADKGPVTVELSGTQKVSDVFFFEAQGGRSTSQTLVGIDSCSLPVHASATLNGTDRVLNLYKKTTDGTPLENITFEIYRVCTLEDYLNGSVAIGSTPTEADIATYAVPENRVATVTTDKDGIASCNFGAVDGVYLVVELKNDVISQPVDPFFVAVPGGDSENPEYAVNVYPKNTVIDEDVDIEKDVIEIDQNEETLDVNEVHTWIIQASIPAGLAAAQKYEISDTLDYRLTYKGNVTVTVSGKTAPAGEDALILEEGADYTLSVSQTTDAEGHTVDKFVVSLTAEGMENAAAYDSANYEIRVYFDAVINENAQLGQEIPNQAHIDYINNVGTEYEDDSDEPFVYTGGLKLHKTDASDVTKKLAGATFRLARKAAEGETPDDQLTIDGEPVDVVYVEFYDNADMTGEKVTQVTTGEDGVALFYGLAYGEYYLVETAAPEGYNKLLSPVVVTISADSHLDDDTTTDAIEGTSVTVRNSAEFELPAAGGMGTTVFTVVGVALMGVALMLLLGGRKKEA